MSNNIQDALQRLFKKHRLVFWYDAEAKLSEAFEDLSLSGVEKYRMEQNPFYVKYLVTQEEPEQSFLLYAPYARPDKMENWLLDLELGHYLFHTDEASLFLQELGWEGHFRELVEEHLPFFQSKERRAAVKKLCKPGDRHGDLRRKMLAVTFGAYEPSLDACLLEYARAYYEERHEELARELQRFALKEVFWKVVERQYQYQAQEPGIYDFLLACFTANTPYLAQENPGVNQDSRILLQKWPEMASGREAFRNLSARISDDLGVRRKMESARLELLVEDRFYEAADLELIRRLEQALREETLSADQLMGYLRKRRTFFWYEAHADLYECLEQAAQLFSSVQQFDPLEMDSPEQAVRRYAEDWFRPDYHYRKFVELFRRKPAPILQQLGEKVEKIYVNSWMPRLQRAWQQQLDQIGHWKFELIKNQRLFFRYGPAETASRRQRIFIIISDALRYEAGYEFAQQIQHEKRFAAETDYLLATLPSYTQLGMAALLPHQELSIVEGSDQVLSDGKPTQGQQNRAKVLQQGTELRSTVILAEELMQMNSKTEGREFAKQYDLIYVYHNRIDKVGDDTTSETKVFDAVAEEQAFLIDLCRKIANIGGNNMYLTADHGFLYQAGTVAESDFLPDNFSGKVWKKHRRFVLGTELETGEGLVKYTAAQLNLGGQVELLVPRGLQRLRVQGAGSRYVHGGSSLQEVVVPLVKVKVSKKKGGSNTYVGVDILKSSERITTVNAVITFVQTEAVEEGVLPTTIRASFVDNQQQALSDTFLHTFDREQGNDRESMVRHTFTLSAQAAQKYRGQEIHLVLEQQIPNSERWREYKAYRFQLIIQSDRDFEL
jgi:uncharacterized protein (TIGR02687 family)